MAALERMSLAIRIFLYRLLKHRCRGDLRMSARNNNQQHKRERFHIELL
jgi:hypothetical protein